MVDFTGSSGDDVFTGGSDNDTIVGNAGNDQLSGGGGTDFVSGDSGSDILAGDDGDDAIFASTRLQSVTGTYFGSLYGLISNDTGAEVDQLSGGAGDDLFFAGFGDFVDGGASGSFGNRLWISFQGAPAGVTADFRLLQSQGFMTIGGGTITNIQNVGSIEGSNFDDYLVPIDTYYPSGGNVYGRGGNDTIIADYYSGWAGSGIWGDDGNDDIDATGAQYGPQAHGGAGDDIIRMRSGLGDTAFGDDGNDIIYAGGETHGGAGNDVIYMQGTYYSGTVTGDDGDDQIFGADNPYGGNSLYGGNGADHVIGSAGNDTISSGAVADPATPGTTPDDNGAEHDILEGRAGDDTIRAGIGDDVDGGSGTDTLRLSLGGAASGVTINTGAILSGTPFLGGLIQNVESLVSLKGSAFGDSIFVANQSSLLTISGGTGDDVVTTNGSSVSFNGEDGNDTLVSGVAGDIFYGGAGTDTISYAAYTSGVTVTLNLTDTAAGTGAGGDQLYNVENITGSAQADTLTGNNLVNTLIGGDGNDILTAFAGDDALIGGAGADDLRGGIGSDSYYVDTGDTITEGVNQGTDRAYASASFALGAGQNVEFLSTNDDAGTAAINLFGNDLANTITGNAGINILYGYDENDVLQGLGGNDVLVGGNGNDRLDGGTGTNELLGGNGDDTYVITNRIDTTYELSGEGTDTVETTLAIYQLQSQVENLTLTDSGAHGAGVGNTLGNVLTGNVGVDDLFGREGNDTLRGGTGAANTLLGQEGDDIYIVEAAGDSVIEFANEGMDTVQTALASFTLRDNVENLVFTGSGAFTGIGAADANRITGGNGADFLSGLAGDDILTGGGGNDTLLGGTGAVNTLIGQTGDDLYIVEAAGDAVLELANEGTDTVRTALASFTLSENVENLVYTGAVAFSGSGSAGNNNIIGGSGADVLNGLGGSDVLTGGGGHDTLIGGAGAANTLLGQEGDDLYIVEASGDSVVELANQGNDTVQTALASFTLQDNVENLHFTGSGAFVGIGSSANNLIVGGNGADSLNGMGGDDIVTGAGGNDELTGGAGADTFRFQGGDGIDRIYDFTSGSDKIGFVSWLFTVTGTLTLEQGSGPAATTANTSILYDSNTGLLAYDLDGTGAIGAVPLAYLNPGLTLALADFVYY